MSSLIRKYFGKRPPKKSVLFVGKRPMKFPYTFTAKIVQFPYVYYYGKSWVYKYYLIAVVVCLPVFWYINGLANSPENVAKWREIRKKQAMEHHGH